jgi:hypothetical protein
MQAMNKISVLKGMKVCAQQVALMNHCSSVREWWSFTLLSRNLHFIFVSVATLPVSSTHFCRKYCALAFLDMCKHLLTAESKNMTRTVQLVSTIESVKALTVAMKRDQASKLKPVF